MIEKIYCISLKDNEIRRNLMRQQLENLFKDKYKIVDAVTSNNDKVLETFNNLTLKNSNIEALSQIAICYSHIKCLKKIVKHKLIFGAIIEDDIRIRPNINDKIKEYFKNNPKIIEIMHEEPCIIHLCGPYNYVQNINKFKERGNEIIVNICFYMINYMMAKILIDNFYPIKWQFDTYVSKISRDKNIKEFTACPILAWDLSSTLYSNFWTKDDFLIRKSLFSTSKLKKTNNIIMKPNIHVNPNDKSFENYLFCHILDHNKQYNISSQDKLHYLPFNSSFNQISDNTIISGQGISNLNEEAKVPFIILFTRGPLSRNKFVESNIPCPEFYVDPLIIYSQIDKIRITKKFMDINSKYIFLINFDMNNQILNHNKIKIVNINNENPTSIISLIKSNDIIISNFYEILVLSTCYNKVTIPINNPYSTFDIRYLDYLLGFKSIINTWNISKLNYLDVNDIIDLITCNKNINYPQIDYEELKYKQKKIINYLPFLKY